METKNGRVGVDEAIFGKRPADATHWSCRRRDSGRWVWLRHPAADGVELSEWPVERLSVERLRKRWGAGQYRVLWLACGEAGRTPLGHGKVVTLTRPKARSSQTTRAHAGTDVGAVPHAPSSKQVDAVVALWSMAQKQADTWATQYRSEAEHAMVREREYFRLQLEQQKAFFQEMERLRTDSLARAGEPSSQTMQMLKSIVERLDRGGDEAEDEDQGEPPPYLLRVMEQVLPLCAPGVNKLLEAAAGPLARLLDTSGGGSLNGRATWATPSGQTASPRPAGVGVTATPGSPPSAGRGAQRATNSTPSTG